MPRPTPEGDAASPGPGSSSSTDAGSGVGTDASPGDHRADADSPLPALDHASPELLDAFRQFSEMSDRLSHDYGELEKQAAQLTAELARVNALREQELLEKERVTQRLHSLLQLLPGGVVVLDNHGRVQECNPAAEDLLGTPLRGAPWIDVIKRSFAPRVDDGHEVSLQDGRRVSLATRSLEGEPGQILLLTDQTHTRALQARLSHHQRLQAMGKMMASLAHQIRTPLTAATLYSSHLLKPDLTPEQRIKFAGKVKERLGSLELQLRDMLVFARGETKLSDLLSVEQLFAALEDGLDVPLTHADADAECVNETPDCWVQCNREALIGVLLNLVQNALQACGKGTELVIRSRKLGPQRLCLQVEDKGPGMDAQALQRALEPFYTTKSQGTGLGLAVAQVVARAHHGEFLLESEPGKGSIAGVVLPFVAGKKG